METHYCTQWSRYDKRPWDTITEAEARQAHQQGKLYTALLGSATTPHCFLEFTEFRAVGVEFLDLALRTYFDYSFQEKRPGELFISMSRRPEFPNRVDRPDRATVLYFKTDGRVVIARYMSNPDDVGSKMIGREEQIVDVSRNWEPYPEFGDYQGLATLDRGSPWLCPPLPPA